MHSLILHVISKSHPLLASTCTATFYTSYQNPTLSGKYMHSLILHIISKSHPLWQVHAQSHLTPHIKIPPPLASTCTVSPYTSYQNPTPSGKHMHSLALHVISKSHPIWQVHAQSHLTRQIKNPPPVASTCTVSSYTSYQNSTPSGKYMHSLILHVISKSHPLWQVHAESHLTRNLKIPPPLASTVRTTFGSCDVEKVHAVAARSTFWSQNVRSTPGPDHFWKLRCRKSARRCGAKHSWRSIVYGSWFTIHSLRAMVYESWPSWFTNHGLRAMVYESWFTIHSLRVMVYEPWFTIHSLRAMVYRSRSQPRWPPNHPFLGGLPSRQRYRHLWLMMSLSSNYGDICGYTSINDGWSMGERGLFLSGNNESSLSVNWEFALRSNQYFMKRPCGLWPFRIQELKQSTILDWGRPKFTTDHWDWCQPWDLLGMNSQSGWVVNPE